MSKYLFTEEWDEGGVNHIAAYGLRTEKEIDEIREQMESYSPYDYNSSVVTDTEKEYFEYLQARAVSQDVTITHYVKVEGHE